MRYNQPIASMILGTRLAYNKCEVRQVLILQKGLHGLKKDLHTGFGAQNFCDHFLHKKKNAQ